MNTKSLPSREELNALFRYDHDIGELIWKHRSFGELDNKRGYATRNLRFAGKIAGTLHNERREIRLGNTTYFASRIIYKMFTGREPDVVDHIDRNPSNNRLDNLREGTFSQNARNRKTHVGNSHGHKGVTLNNGKWAASIMLHYKRHWGGYYDTPEEAFEAACKLRRKLHGEFACDGV